MGKLRGTLMAFVDLYGLHYKLISLKYRAWVIISSLNGFFDLSFINLAIDLVQVTRALLQPVYTKNNKSLFD
jgi:hypothetical protein